MSELAVLGGSPTKTKPFPAWPHYDEAEAKALQEVDKLVSKRSFPILVIDDIVIQGYQEDKILEAIGHGK